MNWMQLRFFCTKSQQPALEDALLEAGAASLTFEDNADQPILEPELNQTPLWDELIISALFEASFDQEILLAELAQLYGAELPKHHLEILEDKDWLNEWKSQYQPIQMADNLWVCPSWLDTPDPSATNILLDPGLAFGTGTHPTTAMCLKALAGLDLQGKTLIDYGCGSGILAIAALLLGAKSAVAVDIDPQALSATKDNTINNAIEPSRLPCFLPGDEPKEPADILVANILAGPLASLEPTLNKLLKPNGLLILSGLLLEQKASIVESYSNIDFHHSDTTEQWLCLMGRKS